jgi:hypothetical protein
MLDRTVNHLIRYVLPAAAEYDTAETALATAFRADQIQAAWEPAGWNAKRRAADLAIAIDGLTDRCAKELGLPKPAIRSAVAKLCLYPGTNFDRADCMERIRGVANAYKHAELNDPTLPIASDKDVLAIGSDYGMETYGVGQYGGVPEVMVRDKNGGKWKFLGDAPTAVAAWMQFLSGHGVTFPAGPYTVCGLKVHS